VLLALPFAVAKKLAKKGKEPLSADAGLHIATATSFERHIQNMTFGFATMLSSQAKSQQTTHLARRFFTQKHCSSQQREDCAEDLELNLSQMLHSFWLHSEAHDFHLQTTQKACSFWRSAF